MGKMGIDPEKIVAVERGQTPDRAPSNLIYADRCQGVPTSTHIRICYQLFTPAGLPRGQPKGSSEMSIRNLNEELAILDNEIERLETRRTAVIYKMETSTLRRNAVSNLVHFPNSIKIRVSRSTSEYWPFDPVL
jgi:hypothetical protein